MPVYQYVKYHHRSQMRRSFIISFCLLSFGGAVLSWVLWPILSFQFITGSVFASITSPLGSGRVQLETSQQDYTNANIWFPLKPQKKIESKVTAYTLSIPKLRILNALVILGGEDLNKGVIHYGGTALPGENGNSALFGHSVLPQFFNPTNYKTIFSTLPNISTGDDIFIHYDGITYKYKVENLRVTTPEDLTMLEQQYDDSYITLITCVPPGTYWQRLHVRARLSRI